MEFVDPDLIWMVKDDTFNKVSEKMTIYETSWEITPVLLYTATPFQLIISTSFLLTEHFILRVVNVREHL